MGVVSGLWGVAGGWWCVVEVGWEGLVWMVLCFSGFVGWGVAWVGGGWLVSFEGGVGLPFSWRGCGVG